MTEQIELAKRVVDKMMSGDRFSQWLGVNVDVIEPRHAIVSMIIRNEMLNGHNVCHGGIPFSLADTALAFASNTQGRIALSIDASISYPAKILEGEKIIAEARELSTGNKIAVYEVTVKKDDGTNVAFFRGTVYMLDVNHFG